MIRKILISTIVLVFFVSTTGLPLTIHLCSMSKTEMATCKMHSKCMHCENVEHSKYSGSKIGKDDCCKTEFKYEAIGDKFLQINSQKDFQVQNFIAHLVLNLTEQTNQREVNYDLFTGTSPPQLIDNHLYLNNSILLI